MIYEVDYTECPKYDILFWMKYNYSKGFKLHLWLNFNQSASNWEKTVLKLHDPSNKGRRNFLTHTHINFWYNYYEDSNFLRYD